MQNIDMLAEQIATNICTVPNRGVAQRVQLKGGQWPGNETDLGGYCKEALIANIKRTIMTEINAGRC